MYVRTYVPALAKLVDFSNKESMNTGDVSIRKQVESNYAKHLLEET